MIADDSSIISFEKKINLDFDLKKLGTKILTRNEIREINEEKMFLFHSTGNCLKDSTLISLKLKTL